MFVRFPSWHVLKTIGGSYFSSWTMIVPFLGYLILLGSITGTIYSIDLSSLGVGDLELKSNGSFMRLKMTFIGLSVVGFTTIIFRMSCPKEISKHSDREHYILSASRSTFPDEAHRKLALIQKSIWYERFIYGCIASRAVALVDTSQSTAARSHSNGETPPLNREDWLDKNLNSLNAIHSLEYEISNYSLILLRYIIFIFYSIGFVLTLLPSVRIFWVVLVDVITSQ